MGAALRNSFGDVEFGTGQMRNRESPFFFKMSNVLRFMCVVEVVCSRKSIPQWRNMFTDEGRIPALVSEDVRLALLELQRDGQPSWGRVLLNSTQSKSKIAIEYATHPVTSEPEFGA